MIKIKLPKLPLVTYGFARSEIRDGDVLLASGSYAFSKLIQQASNSPWSHVAFVLKLASVDRIMVLESVEGVGVRTIPLSEYTRNFEGSGKGYNGRLAIARHDKFVASATPEKMKAMTQFAVDRFSYPYDNEEIARIATRIVGSALGFTQQDLVRDNEFICSEYVYECYKILGIDIAYNPLGFIAPANFADDINMKLLWELQVEENN